MQSWTEERVDEDGWRAYLIAAWTRSEILVAQVEFFNAERTDLLLFIFIDELILLYPSHCVQRVWREAWGGEGGEVVSSLWLFEGDGWMDPQLRRAPVEIGGLIKWK